MAYNELIGQSIGPISDEELILGLHAEYSFHSHQIG